MRKVLLALLLLAVSAPLAAQPKRVLFVGNSYTYVNDLPGTIAAIANNMGDTISHTSVTPGGCTFSQHCSGEAMTTICQGGWDVVVLQEQSQLPSFPQSQVENECLPYAARLVDSVYAHNPCAEPMFYMTWGRRDGDAQNARYFPVLGSYWGMDSMLCERYTYMAEANDASLCPVGRVWRYLRTYHPDINLYDSDGSHPSVAGTYAAACAFYVMLFQRNPGAITYRGSLPFETAQTIREAVRQVVFLDLPRWQRPQPQALMAWHTEGLTLHLADRSLHADRRHWSFGDGETLATTDTLVSHTYADSGNYNLMLVAGRHCMADTMSQTVTFGTVGLTAVSLSDGVRLFPNPAHETLTVLLPVQQCWATLFALDGRCLWHRSLSGPHAVVPLDGLPAGLYLLQVSTPTGIVQKPFIVE